MFNKSCQKRGSLSFGLSGMLLTATLLIWPTPTTSNAGEAIPAVVGTEEASSSTPTSSCKGLKPFNDIDELLYQLYINLDSDCLFNMPVAELEKIWYIKILSNDGTNPDEYAQLRESPHFRGKPYKSKVDAFYLEVDHAFAKRIEQANFFKIMTTERYGPYRGLLDGADLPKLLPFPDKIYTIYPKQNRDEYESRLGRAGCYWSNSDPYSGRIHEMRFADSCAGVKQITIR